MLIVRSGIRLSKRLDEAGQVIADALTQVTACPYLMSSLWFTRGLIQRDKGHAVEAQEAFEKAATALGELPAGIQTELHREAHWNLSEIYYQQARYREAAASLQNGSVP